MTPQLGESATPRLNESATPWLGESATPRLDESATPWLGESGLRWEKKDSIEIIFSHTKVVFPSEIRPKRPEYDNLGLFLRP